MKVLERHLVNEVAMRDRVVQLVREQISDEFKLQETRNRATTQDQINEFLDRNTATLGELREDMGKVQTSQQQICGVVDYLVVRKEQLDELTDQ